VIQTDDLFLGALGLVRGGELLSVEVHGSNGRRMAVFRIDDPEWKTSSANTTAALPRSTFVYSSPK